MKNTAIALGIGLLFVSSASFAQESNAGSSSSSAAITTSSSASLSGGSAITSVGTSNNNTTAGNAFSATINVNNPATDPNASTTQTPKDAGALGSASNPITNKTEVKSVGNPAAMSLATSFSQYNCANSAGAGAGWMGGVFSIGGAVESGPCNARANAAALVSLASVLPVDDPMRRQLIDAAIRLIGESTMATEAALKASNVGFFTTVIAQQPKMIPQVPALVDKPGVYVGNDAIVMSRLGISPQVAMNPQSAQSQPVQPQNPPAPTPIK